MEDEYMEQQEAEAGIRIANDSIDSVGDISKEFGEGGYEEGYDDEEGGNNYRGNNRMRGNFRNRGRGMPPPGWMNGPPPPMRFRGRGYGPAGPPMRGRGFFRGRGGPRGFNNGPNFDNNWGPMGPPPPGMMGGPPPFGPPPGMMPPGGPMGPPPNMMQPPPFGGPPGMPPPNMQPAPELWVETKSDEGKSYYYHSRTRETTWTRPQESATCKVVTQSEVEAMAAAGQLPGMGGPAIAMNGPMGGMGGPPMGGMNNGVMPGPSAGMPPFMQPPPWVKDAANDNEKARGDVSPDNDESSSEQPMMQQPNGNMMPFQGNQNPPNSTPNTIPGGPMPNHAMPMQSMPGGPMGGPMPGPGGPMGAHGGPMGGHGGPMGGPGQMGGPGSMPGPGGPMGGPMGGPNGPPGGPMGGPGGPGGPGGAPWGGWGGWPPPLNNQPPGTMQQPPRVTGPPTSVPSSQPQAMPPLQTQPIVNAPGPTAQRPETVVPPELTAAANEWSCHRAPDGRAYYYHAAKHLSVWEKPPVLKQIEELQAKIAAEKAGKPENEAERMVIDESKIEVIDLDADDEAKATAAAAAEAERQADAEREQREQAEREQAEREKAEREKAEKEKADKEKAKQDRSRPISTTPISGTPWCVVWTGDGLVFFYNPTARLSVWERPAALANRADVDRAVAVPPPQVKELNAMSNASAASSKTSNGEKRAATTDSDSDVEPAKKTRQEEPKKATAMQRADSSTEAEIAAAQQRAKVPFDVRAEAFTKLMVEKQVSAFSTWEKELHKIVFDQRYLMLNCKERKQVFDKFVRDRAEAERKEKRNRLQQVKLQFRQLMEEAKLHSKSSYSEFSSKHSREDRFKAIEKARDRELYFNEYIAEVRKKEKEDREKKREQAKTDFIALLKEKSVDRRARWVDVKKKVDSDPRYKAVENSILREDYFREYCKMVKDERKKEKEGKEKEKVERDRSSKKDKKDKDRDKDKDKDKESKKDKKREKDADTSTEQDESKTEPEADTEGVGEAEEDTGSEADAEAKERAARAVKERAKEVQRVLANSLRDRDKERQHHQRDEAVQHFNALLADLVRNPDLSWRDAKKQLKKDHRYTLAELLSKDDKERLFALHVSAAAAKRRAALHTALGELNVRGDAQWAAVKPQLAQLNTVSYTSSTQMERDFREYLRAQTAAAKSALRQLLQETRCLTKRSQQATLLADPRYTALDHLPEERQAIIDAHVEELEKKPAPPTAAAAPTRRSRANDSY